MSSRHSTMPFSSNHSDMLLSELNKFRANGQFTDVVLQCNKISIPAHKNILAASSPYFMAMFNGHFPESKQREIPMEEIDANCLALAVEFIYSGRVVLTADCVQQLLEVATFLQLDHLADLCGEYMSQLLDVDNCLGFKHFAEKQNNFILLDAAKDFLITHFLDVVQSEEFNDMSYAEIADVLRNDELYMHSDDTVLRGLASWAAHCPEERTKYLGSLLRYIHPACVSADVAQSLTILQQKEADTDEWMHDVLDYNGHMDWQIFVLDKMGRQPDLKRFDLNTNAMTQLKPYPRSSFAISLAAYKNILYVQGGTGTGRSTRECFYYNIYRNQWFELRPLLIERSHQRSLVLNDCLYAIGGNTLQGATSTVECLNLITNKASFLENMSTKRSSMGAVVCEQSLYVMGGETDHRSLFSVERFDQREGVWQDMPQLHEVNSYCSSALIDNSIYCCEGLGHCMERFDLRANKWQIIDFWEDREFYEIFAVNNNLYSISGEEISRYDIGSNKWSRAYKFDELREWDTAVGLQMMNYSIQI